MTRTTRTASTILYSECFIDYRMNDDEWNMFRLLWGENHMKKWMSQINFIIGIPYMSIPYMSIPYGIFNWWYYVVYSNIIGIS